MNEASAGSSAGLNTYSSGPAERRAASPTGSITSLPSRHTVRSSGAFGHSRSQLTLSSLSDDDDTVNCAGETFAVGEYHLSACPICLERFTLENPAIIVQCEHGFHLQCLESWRMRSTECPVCLRSLTPNEGRLMQERDTRRRRRRHRVALTSATASLRLMSAPATSAGGTVMAETEEGSDGDGQAAHCRRFTYHQPDATTAFLASADRGDIIGGGSDMYEEDESGRTSCFAAVWGWLTGWCVQER